MRIHCPRCRKLIDVPDERASQPKLKVKCGGCELTFPFSQASLALRSPEPQSALPPPVPVAAASPSAAPEARETRHASVAAPASGRRPLAAPAPAAGARSSWRRCGQHPQTQATSVCPACQKGYCFSCERRVQTAVLCPVCEGLCIPAAKHAEALQTQQRRARPMGQELATISGYPLVDRFAFVLLAVFTWFFGLFKGWSGIALLFSNGVLLMYSFTAVSKVSGGNLREYMPDYRDIYDLVRPLRLGLAALIVSAGPLVAVVLAVPAAALLVPGLSPELVAEPSAADPGLALEATSVPLPADAAPGADETAQVDDFDPASATIPVEGAEPPPAERPVASSVERAALGTGLLILFALALVWKIVYTPVALTVAALTGSFWQTLNPVLGVETIFRMGSTYWQAAGIYTLIAAIQWGLGLALGLVPIAGGFVGSFVDAYAYLAIGCTLGLAVFKKARELGLD